MSTGYVGAVNTWGVVGVLALTALVWGPASFFIGWALGARTKRHQAAPAVLCPRCGHSPEEHWFPETTALTTACVTCLALGRYTKDPQLGNTGVCAYTADYVRFPW